MEFRAWTGAAVAVAMLVMGSSPALAADIDFTSAAAPICGGLSTTALMSGQVFTIPAGETRLTSVTLGLSSDDVPPTGGTLTLHRVTAGVVDATILATGPYTVTVNHPDFDLETLTLPGGGLSVTAGETYAIFAERIGGSGQCLAMQGDVYGDGTVYQNGAPEPTEDAVFAARFASAVPTMTEWAMILMGLLLAGSAAAMIQRQRLTA